MAHERRAYILRLLEQRGTLRSSELAQELGVTDETIRTDMVAMERQGLLRRTHGGATYIPPTGGDEDGARLDCQLADLVARHFFMGQGRLAVYLDAAAFALALFTRHPQLDCRVYTANPAVLHALSPARFTQEVFLVGSRLDRASGYLEGDADAGMAALKPDLALLCPPSVPAPQRAAYRHALPARWAAAASRHATRKTLVVGPAAIFAQIPAANSPATLHNHTFITEENLPPDYQSIPRHTVPYIDPADITQGDRFDY
ncbi:MAG: DeoR family transcriptional regulator [Akkermansia sp.]|nr:DeoR family transcriptional regulator [Akkermansia sp.]